ncbi:MAG: ribokinase [Pirellulales bacterium]|nr:ribokinase [Pirellulales bacterium]
MPDSSNITVIGSVNTDMVVKGKRLPGPGETVAGGQFVLAGGGKGANQAVAAARLGARVTLVAKVGHDMFGDQAVAQFQREGIVTDGVIRDPDHATGVALILVDEKGENLISVASGANHALRPEEVEQAASLIQSADVVMFQLEIPTDCAGRGAEIAARAGVPVILNPAPASPLDESILRHVTYLTPNETEAEGLTGVAVRDEASARTAAKKLQDLGVRHVIITLGPKGALAACPEGMQIVPSVPVQAVDTTAAGDAFNGGLACAVAAGKPLFEAVRQANLVAALSVTRLGAQPSLPTAEELRRFTGSK